MKTYAKQIGPLTDKQWVRRAVEKWHEEGSIEIDDGASVSVSVEEDGETVRGAYVQAWVWVEAPEGAES